MERVKSYNTVPGNVETRQSERIGEPTRVREVLTMVKVKKATIKKNK